MMRGSAVAARFLHRLGWRRPAGLSASPHAEAATPEATASPAGEAPETPVRIARFDTCLADLTPEDLRTLIADLNAQTDTVGCAVFRPPGEHACVLTIFAGNSEGYFMLAAARKLRCPIIYLQDPTSGWYQGSPLLPDLDTICRRIVVPETGTARALLFGQSAGAYAVLAASVWLPGATVVGCAPQTFSDKQTKDRITFIGVRALASPDGLIDLHERLRAHPDPEAMRAIVIAAGELDNPAHMHWWGDYIHMLRMADVPNTHLYVVNSNIHVIAHRRVNEFARLLAELAAAMSSPPGVRADVLRSFLTDTFVPP